MGGGPSLIDFDWQSLVTHPRVLVVNRAVKDCSTASIFFTEDLRVIQLFAPQLNRFKGIKIFHCLDTLYKADALATVPGLTIIDRVRPDKFWSKGLHEGLSYSSNSMIGALNLADILGAKRIYLLGVDCRGTNYHSDYKAFGESEDPHKMDSFRSDFELWAALHLRHRALFNVINPSKPSALTCWPTIEYDRFYKIMAGEPIEEVSIKIKVDLP